MNERFVMTSILENLNKLSALEERDFHYRNIMKIARKSKQEITKNIRGYWFDLVSLEPELVQDIYNYLETIPYNEMVKVYI